MYNLSVVKQNVVVHLDSRFTVMVCIRQRSNSPDKLPDNEKFAFFISLKFASISGASEGSIRKTAELTYFNLRQPLLLLPVGILLLLF